MVTIRFDIKNLFQIFAIVLVGYIVYTSYQVLLIAIFGFLLAYMLNPLVEKLVHIKVPRPLSVMFVVFLVGGTVFTLFMWLLPQVFTDINRFTGNIPLYVAWTMDRLLIIGEKLDMDLSASTLYNHLSNKLRESSTEILRWMGGVAGSVQYAVGLGLNIVLVPVIMFFALLEYPRLTTFMNKYGGDKEHGVHKYISLFGSVMSSYFRGQFIVMAVLCVLYSAVLKIIGLDAALLLGITAGLLSIVPYLGFTIGIVLSVVIAAIQFQDLWHPLYVIIGFGIVQVIESFYITPRVMGSALGINPVATIIVLLVGGAVAGILGMIFALPIAAALFKIYKDKFAPKEDIQEEIQNEQ
jgi:predicted PurR-regulated permease PerM